MGMLKKLFWATVFLAPALGIASFALHMVVFAIRLFALAALLIAMVGIPGYLILRKKVTDQVKKELGDDRHGLD